MKYILSSLIALACLASGFAQEPANHAVQQPVASQSGVTQPSVSQPSVSAIYAVQPVAYLSESVLASATPQVIALQKRRDPVIPPEQHKLQQTAACKKTVQP